MVPWTWRLGPRDRGGASTGRGAMRVGHALWLWCVTLRPMLALAMLSLTGLRDACTYSVLNRCGTEYRAPQMACYEAVARCACLPWLMPALTGGSRTRTRVSAEERRCAPVARRRLQVLARLVEARASAQHTPLDKERLPC